MSDQNTIPQTTILENIKNLPLRVIFIIHFIFITWGVQGYWSPTSYLFYNLLFFATIIWSLHNKENEEPILLCLLIDALSILFDLIILCLYFPDGGSSEKFSGVMAIFNLLIRPISCLSLYKQCTERINGPPTDFNFASSSSANKPKNYQDIESQSYPGIDNLSTPYQ